MILQCIVVVLCALTSPTADGLGADLNRDGVIDTVEFERGVVIIRDGLTGRTTRRIAPTRADVRFGDPDHDGQLEVIVDHRPVVARDLPAPVRGDRRALGGGPECLCVDRHIVWDSDDDLANVWSVAVGDFDGDGLGELLTVDWPTPTMRLYETAGDDLLMPTFATPEAAAPPGAFVAVTAGDSDGDGAIEIIGGETSTLNQVLMYEAVGDDLFEQRAIGMSEPDPLGNQSIGKIMVADTDQDGRMEIIFDTASSVIGSSSDLFIYEHNGIPGDHIYTRVFDYTTVSYLFSWTIGDADNDGATDIVLGLGGVVGLPVSLRRLENTGDNSYEHKLFEPGNIGLNLAPTVADVDGDGLNEVVFGGLVEDNTGGVLIYDAAGDDLFVHTTSLGGLDGSAIASAVAETHCGDRPVILAGSSAGEFIGVVHDGVDYGLDGATDITTAGQIRAIAVGTLDGDDRADIGLASKGDDQALVIEADDDTILDTCEACTGTADCADANGDGRRDDPCAWAVCAEQACDVRAVVFGDVAGRFGACEPDGVADGHDRFAILNCFSNLNPQDGGPYHCEEDAPQALNTDVGGEMDSCTPDGLCDANDAFLVLSTFGNGAPCSCPGP